MKLAYVANIRLPTEKAHGIQIMEMCGAFSNMAEVVLIVPKRLNHIKKDPFNYYGINKSFKIIKLPCLDLTSFGLGNFGFFIQTLTFLISAKIYLMFFATSGKKYDILYTREQLSGLFFKEFVLEVHSLPKMISSFNKKIWQKAKALVVLTGFIKNTLIKNSIDQDKILVVPDGVNLDLFDIDISKDEARKRTDLPLDKKIIMYTGSFYLYDWKGIDILLDSSKYFSQKDLTLVLVGGNNEEILKIKEKYQFKNIILIPRVPYSDVAIYLKSADVLVLPNKKGNIMSEEYTSPLKLFEYMASGVPIAASDLPSIREILNENNAILIEPNNSEKLAQGINMVLTNKVMSKRIAERSYKEVGKYSWLNRARIIINFIK